MRCPCARPCKPCLGGAVSSLGRRFKSGVRSLGRRPQIPRVERREASIPIARDARRLANACGHTLLARKRVPRKHPSAVSALRPLILCEGYWQSSEGSCLARTMTCVSVRLASRNTGDSGSLMVRSAMARTRCKRTSRIGASRTMRATLRHHPGLML
jgi:hypothetical protein